MLTLPILLFALYLKFMQFNAHFAYIIVCLIFATVFVLSRAESCFECLIQTTCPTHLN